MDRRRKITDEQIATIEEMRGRGKTYAQIASVIGCSEKAISWHCLKLGVEPPRRTALKPNYHLTCPEVRRGGHVVRAFTPDEDRRMLQLEAKGLGYSAIGRALGRTPNSIRGRLLTLIRREERAAS